MKLEWTNSPDDLPSDKRAQGGEEGNHWSFLIERDSYNKGRWILRGWRNGEGLASLGEGRLTLREAKAIAASKAEGEVAMKVIKWTRKPFMGVPTYHGSVDDWKFTIDKPYSTHWILRGWKSGETAFSVNREHPTLVLAKAAATALAKGLNPDKPCGCSSNYECSLCEMKGGQS